MKRKILSLLLAITMTISYLPITSTAAEGDAAIRLTNKSEGPITLKSGKYYIDSNVTACSTNRGQKGGIMIEENATVILDIKAGAVLQATGCDGHGLDGGGAGIYLPESSTLIVKGEGKLIAIGGCAGSPTNGQRGENALCIPSENMMYAGNGGNGGNGGGGAGAGIGGSGGCASTGGEGGKYVNLWYLYGHMATYTNPESYCDKSGDNGTNGGAGGDGDSIGKIYITGNITADIFGGKSVANGASPGAGSNANDAGSGFKNDYSAGGGGGGGGGSSGLTAPDIGGGAGAGGAGGGGGAGGTRWKEDEYAYPVGGNGGPGGQGGAAGVRCVSVTGGAGGSGGAHGKTGSNNGIYIGEKVKLTLGNNINPQDINKGVYLADSDGNIIKEYTYDNCLIPSTGQYEARNEWLSKIRSDTKISQLTIPGTHDSASKNVTASIDKGEGIAHCQDWTIQEQLNAGIRALDLRWVHEGGSFKLYHGYDTDMFIGLAVNFKCRDDNGNHLSLESVFSILDDFLKNHPGEALFLNLQREGGSSDTGTYNALEELKNRYSVITVSKSNMSSITLGECRGKIVDLTCNIGEAEGDYNDWNAVASTKVSQMHAVFSRAQSFNDPNPELRTIYTSISGRLAYFYDPHDECALDIAFWDDRPEMITVWDQTTYVKNNFLYGNPFQRYGTDKVYGFVLYDFPEQYMVDNTINANNHFFKLPVQSKTNPTGRDYIDYFTTTLEVENGTVSPNVLETAFDESTVMPEIIPNLGYKVPETNVWKLDGATSNLFVADNKGTYKPLGNDTLRAICEERSATLSYSTGCDMDISSTTMRYTEETKISDIVPTKDFYTFIGWASSPLMLTPEYQPGDIYREANNLDKLADSTLYAVWNEKFPYIENPPEKIDLEYNGKSQKLTTEAKVENGTVYYALGVDDHTAPSAASWSLDVPTGKEPGNYFVWYKIKGDEDYRDVSPMFACLAEIEKAEQKIIASDLALTFTETGRVEASAEGTISYSVVSGNSVRVDENTGELTILGIGESIIQITATETDKYKVGKKILR